MIRFITGFPSGSSMNYQCGNFILLPVSDKQDPLLRVAHHSESYCWQSLRFRYDRNLEYFSTIAFNNQNKFKIHLNKHHFNIKMSSFAVSYLSVIRCSEDDRLIDNLFT